MNNRCSCDCGHIHASEAQNNANKANSANYLYIIIGVPLAALLIAMAPALQARFPQFPVQTFVQGAAGLLIQALPFTLIGVLVSAAVETWVTASFIERHAPKTVSGGLAAALLAGLIMPVCDCVIVPTFSRLVARKLPLPCAVTFLCAVPVMNPVSLWATWYAFADIPAVVIIRILFGAGIALVIGMSFVIFPYRRQVLRDSLMLKAADTCVSCGVSRETNWRNRTIGQQIREYSAHVYADFMSLMPIVFLGTLVACGIRTWLGSDPASRINTTVAILIIPAMMLIAYASSLCSSSDAVIARSLVASLPISSVLVFLLFGPMLDLKNTLMLLADCKVRFVLRITLSITVACLLAGLVTHWAWGFA